MRNLLLALLLANILYFLYAQFVEPPPETGIVVVRENDLGPPLELADAVVPEAADSEGAEPGAGRSSALAAAVGQSCATVGPFRESGDADLALEDVLGDGMSGRVRSADGEVFIGHWVQIRDISDRAAGNAMIDKLKEGGLGDAYLVQTQDEGIKISLGLFGEVARAERVELQAKSLGLPAEIAPRMGDATLYFVDVALPPGRGAGAIVDKYGEGLVLLRSEATCPQSV